MPKIHCTVGFAEFDNQNGIWNSVFKEYQYHGEIIRNTRKLQNSGNINDNIVISNDISIIADPYARNNFHAIRYVTYMGTKWIVNSVDVQFPRLVLSLGGVYNE